MYKKDNAHKRKAKGVIVKKALLVIVSNPHANSLILALPAEFTCENPELYKELSAKAKNNLKHLTLEQKQQYKRPAETISRYFDELFACL